MTIYFILYILILNVSISCASRFAFKSKIGFGLSDFDIGHDNQKHSHGQVYGATSQNDTSDKTMIFLNNYFLQILDHARPTKETTWKQRYYVNDLYYEKGGPMFLFIYGESEMSPKWMSHGHWILLAKKFNAMCYCLEHRFYGKSNPTKNSSLENLVYLTTEQALADIANFIKTTNSRNNLPAETKWILFGGSYAGSLVAWAREKYPHLVHGAVSSSAPILAQTDFPEYYQVAQESLATHSAKCVENIRIANRQLKSAVKNKMGRARISKLFRLCKPLKNNQNDISTLFEFLSDSFAFAVQYNKKKFSIDTVCKIMTNKRKSIWPIMYPELNQYAEVNKKFLEYVDEPCLPHEYDKLIKYYRNETFTMGRLWLYQTCSEYGFYQTSSNPSDLFGDYFPLDYYIKMCQDVFGSSFHEEFINNAVRRTNIEMGGLSYDTSNTLFIHGSLDPWHALGLIEKRSNTSSYDVIYIKGTAHCGDMYPTTDDDSENLKSARGQISKTLENWLKE